MTPAGFWRRSFAYAIDWLLLALLLAWFVLPILGDGWNAMFDTVAAVQEWMLSQLLSSSAMPSPVATATALLTDPVMHATIQSLVARISLAILKAGAMAVGLAAIYFIAFEASAWQATPGKRLLGLFVTDVEGHRPGVARAAARFFAGSVSWLSLNLGHAIAGWRVDGRALHDLVAGTRVDRRRL